MEVSWSHMYELQKLQNEIDSFTALSKNSVTLGKLQKKLSVWFYYQENFNNT